MPGLALLGAGVALVWHPESRTVLERPSAPTRPQPEFEAVKVSSDTPSGLSVSGTVRDAFGKPIADAEVFLAASTQAHLASVPCPVCNQTMLSCPSRQTWTQVGELLHDHRGELTAGAAVRTDAEGKFRFENLMERRSPCGRRRKGMAPRCTNGRHRGTRSSSISRSAAPSLDGSSTRTGVRSRALASTCCRDGSRFRGR